jgi:hypothetical protein
MATPIHPHKTPTGRHRDLTTQPTHRRDRTTTVEQPDSEVRRTALPSPHPATQAPSTANYTADRWIRA